MKTKNYTGTSRPCGYYDKILLSIIENKWNENQKEFYGSWDEQTSETKSKYYNEMYELLVE